MKKLLVAIFITLFFAGNAIAQTARITVTVANTDMSGSIYIFDQQAQLCSLNRNENYIKLDNKHTGSANINVSSPHTISIDFTYNHGNNYLMYVLFLSPGDDLHINLNFNKADYTATVTGKGSNNNQQEIQKLTRINLDQFKQDTLPNRVIAAINKQSKANQPALNAYIKQYAPSAAAIKAIRAEQVYFATQNYYIFKENNKFMHMDAYKRNFNKWQGIQDSLFKSAQANNTSALLPIQKDKDGYAGAKLSDGEALASYNYQQLIFWVLLRETEKGRMESEENPKAFYKQWYHTNPTEGKKRFAADGKNLFTEKVLNHYFSGATAEYLYASTLRMSILESNYTNIGPLFDHFKQKYPNSKYINCFSARIAEALKKQNGALNDRMVFVKDNGSKLNSLKELLAITKGKTVLIDMWGTWCSPCREEIEAHSAALHSYFKGKPVDFLYVDNFDVGKEQQWKKLIAYYQIEGTHILASDKLTKDMMNKLHFTGYPSYILIKKDGSCHLTKTQYPINRQAMIKELEAAM